MQDYKLFDAEYRLMDIIWELEPVNSTQLCRVCLERLGWKKATTYTMLRKLGDRGLLRNQSATVTALVGREEFMLRPPYGMSRCGSGRARRCWSAASAVRCPLSLPPFWGGIS